MSLMTPVLFDMCFASNTFHMKGTDGGNINPEVQFIELYC